MSYPLTFRRGLLLVLCTALSMAGAAGTACATTYPAAASLLSGVFTDGNPTALPYRYFVPVGYNAAATGTKYPLVIFLHGQGERGTDNATQLNNNANGSLIFIASDSPNNQTNFPCFYVAPQCPGEAGAWDSGNGYAASQVYSLVNYFLSHYNIDPDRIYLTGLSSGGGGVTFLLAKDPTRWAAAAVCSGWADGDWNSYCHIPFWAFHCADDPEVGITGMDAYIDNARDQGATPIYSRYLAGGHSAWNYGYNPSTPLVAWMMAQRRGQGQSKLVGPSVTISSPTAAAAGTFSTGANTLVLTGTAGDVAAGVTSLSWTNYSQWTGSGYQTGGVSGLQSWSSSIPLNGGYNQLQVIASGVAYASPGNGATTFSAGVDVNQSNSGDNTAPVLNITSPTTLASYVSSTPTLVISGSATDDRAVTSVTWSNSRGGSGTAQGTSSWSTAPITLASGNNIITIAAFDAAGNVASRALTVSYSPPAVNQAPVVDAGPDQVINTGLVALLSGTVSDDGLPAAAAVTAHWTLISGPGSATFGNASALATSVTFATSGVYTLQLSASDTQLSGTDSIVVTVNPLAPNGWSSQDIGSPAKPGSATLSNNIFTVSGSGADIWGNSDSFQFAYQTLNGDGTLVARVIGMQNTNTWAKAALMMRSSLNANSADAFVCVSPGSGAGFMYRTQTGDATHVAYSSGVAPIWMKISRAGNVFSGFTSSDGQKWTAIGTTTIVMPSQIYLGFAVTSKTSALNSATFDSVALTTPSVWTDLDIGAPTIAGSSTVQNSTYMVKGCGSDIWNTADTFHFTFRTMNGDGSIIARVASIQNTNTWAKAGVMIRGSSAKDAPYALACLTPGSGAAFQWRTATATSAHSAAGVAKSVPGWVKLVRSGSSLTGYVSVDGLAWTSIGTTTFTLPTQVDVGFAVCSHNSGALCSAAFTDLSIN